MLWQVGGGTRASPFVAMEYRPAGSAAAGVAWDVTPWVRTANRVNNLTLTIRNLDPLGRTVTVDHASLEVTYGPKAPKSTTAFPVTLFVTEGYDSRSGALLSQLGLLSAVTSSNDVRVEIAPGAFASYRFQGVPDNAVIQSAKVYVEHHEEAGFAPGGAVWRVGGGSLQSPATLAQSIPAVLSGESSEATAVWGVGGVIDSATLVNDLKFVVRNKDLLGKKTKIDRVYVIVTYKDSVLPATPAPPCSDPAPLLGTPDPPAPGYIVMFKDGIDGRQEAERLAEHYNFELRHIYEFGQTGFSAEMPPEVVAALRCEPSVKYVEHNQVVEPH
jgi:hypothetical protein